MEHYRKNTITLILLLVMLNGQETNISQRTTDSLYAVSFYKLGKKYYKLNDSENTLLNLKKALNLFEAGGFIKQVGVAHNRIAMTYFDLYGNPKQAEKHWLKTLEIREELSDSSGIARVKHYLGNVYKELDNYQKARESYKESLEFWEAHHNVKKIIQNLNSLGLLEIERERHYFAEKYFNQIMDSLGENDHENRAKVLNNLGYIAFSKGNYGKAHEYYIQSINLYGEHFSNNDKIKILLNLGNVFIAYKDTVSARIHYHKALELVDDHKENKSLVYNNIGVYYTIQNSYNKGLDYLTKSLKIKKEIGDKKGIIHTLTNIGDLFQKKGEKKEARKHYKKARQQSRDLGYIQGESQSLYNLGFLELEEGEFEFAMEYFQEGLEKAKELENDYFGYIFNEGLGDVFSAGERYDLTVRHYDRAIEHAENIRRGIGLEGHRSSFMAGVMDVYRKLAKVQIKLGKDEHAYHTFERMKARNLLDILDGAFLVYEDEMTHEEIEKQQLMESRLRIVNKEISNFTFNTGTTRSLDSLTREIRNARRSMDKFKSGLYFKHPELKRKMGEGDPIRSRDAVKLLNLNEAAIAYMVEEDNTFCFLLKREGRRKYTVKSFKLDITRDEINKKTSALRLRWGSGTSKWLYSRLVTPIKNELEGVTQLCIVPDSYLHNLPFHALKNSETGDYMIQEYTIYYVNSLSALDELRSFGTAGKEQILAFGNPDFGEKGVATLRGEFAALPATEDEVKSIGSIFGDRSLIMTGKIANEKEFKSNAGDFGILHLATHGVMDELNPMYSAILLSTDEKNDGFLTAREILKTELNADLTVLSACETASGKLTEGEGMLGLSRAFFGAEVPSLVATLWSVGDESTRDLMEIFYLEMENGIRPAKALRTAQLTLLENPQYNHPVFWAPFVFMGDTE